MKRNLQTQLLFGVIVKETILGTAFGGFPLSYNFTYLLASHPYIFVFSQLN